MRIYVVIIRTTDVTDTFEDIQDFAYGEFSLLEDIELLGQCGNRYRIRLTTKDNFNYNTFEDVMDNAGYDTEFIEAYK